MMKNVISYLGILFCFMSIVSKGAFGQKPEETPKKEKIRVLIVAPEGRPDYYNWAGTAPLLKSMFEATKHIEARIVEDAEILATDILYDYDVLLLHFKNHRPLKRNEQAKKQLMNFVERGGGLFIFHFACGAFEDWPEYELLAGRIWNPKGPQHDPYGPFMVEYVDREHPITQGPGEFRNNG